jgi:hypothetical protein
MVVVVVEPDVVPVDTEEVSALGLASAPSLSLLSATELEYMVSWAKPCASALEMTAACLSAGASLLDSAVAEALPICFVASSVTTQTDLEKTFGTYFPTLDMVIHTSIILFITDKIIV